MSTTIEIVADALSRKPLTNITGDVELMQEVESYVNLIQANWPASTHKLDQLRSATEEDDVLRTVSEFIIGGWPRKEIAVQERIRPFFQVCSELSVINGLVVYQHRTVIPSILREKTLERIHESHQKIAKCRERANMSVWWPQIGQDLNNLLEKCAICLENQPRQSEQPLSPIELPKRSWSLLGTDLFEF